MMRGQLLQVRQQVKHDLLSSAIIGVMLSAPFMPITCCPVTGCYLRLNLQGGV